MSRKCAIRFVVGVNGSGKTQLLQALSEIFLSLENSQLPSFNVAFAYDLEKIGEEEERPATIYLRYLPDTPKSEAIFAVFEPPLRDDDQGENTDWEALETTPTESFEAAIPGISLLLRGNQLPGSAIRPYLPKVLLAYTSGATEAWANLFIDRQTERENLPDAVFEELNPEEERPPDWDVTQELPYRQQAEIEPLLEIEQPLTESLIPSIGIYVSAQVLKLAFFAVAIHQARLDFTIMSTEQEKRAYRDHIEQSIQNNQPMSGLRGLLNKTDWLWLVSVNFQILLQPTAFSQQSDTLSRLYPIATSAIRDPGPRDQPPNERRQLVFDLQRSIPDRTDIDTSTCTALIQEICGRTDEAIKKITAFEIFKHLLSWHKQGWLQDVAMSFHKRHVEDVLLYDWLSDGERVFLGRMALFQLLKGENDAFMILDEPETHFNDVWKREIVDVIDTSLRDNAVEVIISTHSSISLTDVFDTEITLLHKDEVSGLVSIVRPRIPTFGASPNEVMVNIFGASESVGQRATEFLDLVLMLAAHPDQIERLWAMNGDSAAVQASTEFQQLKDFMRELPYQYGDDNNNQLGDYLLSVLKSIHGYAQRTLNEEISVVQSLEMLQEKLGPGYYQFEFRRRLRALRERESSASQN